MLREALVKHLPGVCKPTTCMSKAPLMKKVA